MTLVLMTVLSFTALVLSVTILLALEKVPNEKLFFEKRYIFFTMVGLFLTPLVFFVSALLLP